MGDPLQLQRFVDAQNPVYHSVCGELRDGQKESHWMWFIFPQIRGLGSSHLATVYGISSREEAEAYLGHPVLGPRLRECVQLVNLIEGRNLQQIFGYPDDLKFRSSITLFAAVSEESVFRDALLKYCAGEPDPRTLDLLSISES